MGNRKPLISILIRTYNRESVVKAVSSALAQDYENKEVIVYDDCSTIYGKELLDNVFFGTKLKVIKGKKRVGTAEAANQLVSMVKGTYFIFLDDDDEFYDNQSITELHKISRGYDFIYGDIVVYNNGYESYWKYHMADLSNFRQKIIARNGSGILPYLKGLHRKGFWNKINLKLELNIGEDTLASIRFIEAKGKLTHLPRFVLKYNQHDSNVSHSFEREIELKKMINILQKT